MYKISFAQKTLFLFVLFIALTTALSAQVPVDEFMGINTRRQDPIDRMQAVGFIREYHDWYLNEGFPAIPFNENGSPGYPNSQYRWNEAYQELTYTRFDDFYQEIQDSNIIICPTTLGNILQIIDPSGNIQFNDPFIGQILEQKPIAPGADSLDPAAYIAHAEYLYHYAARYGNTTFSSARANAIIAPKLHPAETLKTGLGNITYLEDWNEQDKTYYPNFPKTFFEPAAYAAMLSADFDGHEQTLGLMSDPDSPNNMISTVGIKNADPNMKVVMGGLTDADLQYVRDMVTWFKANRGANANFGQIPLDAINIHIYVGDDSNVLASTFGVSPESADVKGILQEFVDYRDSLMPGTELWLSEFGYDTNDNSPISVPTIGNNDNYEVQGQWIVRFYLETIAAGFDRAILFDLRDICTQPACALFQSSGLLESLDSMYRPKNSWYYTYTMKNVLKGMNFDSDLSTCSDTTCTKVYRFTDPQNSNKKVYAVWSPTATDTTYQYQLSLEGANAGTLVELELPSIYGIPSNLTGQTPTITVGERPVFVVVGEDYLTPSPCIANLTVDNITCSTARINWDTTGGAQRFQLWKQDGLVNKSDFSHRIAEIVDDKVDASTGTYTVANLATASNCTFFLIPEGVGISDTTNYCSIQITTTTGASSCKIPLDFSWVFDAHSNPLNALALMDEQDDFDPICQTNALPTTLWGANFNDSGMEQASIDLQDYYYIDAITIADVSAIGALTIQMADSPNGPWTTIEQYQTIELNKWVTFTNSIPADKPVRYLRLIASDDDRAVIGELFLCGRLSDFTADIAPGMAQDVQIEGVNCFSADLTWNHPFDEDISHYKVIIGNETQLFPYTAPDQAITISNLQPDTTYNFQILTVDSVGQESDTLTITTNTLPEGDCDLGCNPNCPCQICLNPSWISAETPGNTVPVSHLVDEQSTVAICGQVGTTPTTGWGYDFGPTLPVAILDLQQIYLIESFRFFDSNGADNFKVEYKDTQGNWVELFDLVTVSFNNWVIVDNLNIPARFLRISALDNGSRVNEIAICGYPLCNGPTTTELTETLCQGESIVFNDQTLTTSGVYFDTLATINNCDSFVVLNLDVFDTVHTAIDHAICQGESYPFNGQNLTTAGVYLDTLATSNACDSFITLTLSILNTANTAITHTICQGESYPFNGQNLTAAGIYLDTLTASNTCDSFITLTLNVLNTASTAITHAICQGDNYPFNGQNLTMAGVYLDTLIASNTCDSFITLTLNVLNTANTAITHAICQGESYPFNGQNLMTAGVYLDTLIASNTCDSFITLTLNVLNTSSTAITHAICQGENYPFNGQNLTTAGIYLDTLATSTACDSFVTLTLNVLNNTNSTITHTICQGDSYYFNGQNLTTPDVYLDTLVASNTCDSFITLILNVLNTANTTITHTICQGDSYYFNGQNLTTPDVYLDTLVASTTCDSFITLILNVINTENSAITHTICQGDSYYFNDQNLTTAGVYLDTLSASTTCDSLITLTLVVSQEGDTCDDGNPNTSNDELDENCVCVGENLDPNTCNVTVTLSGDTIKVENMIQPITKLDVYNENWSQVVHTCGNYNCNIDEIITGLPPGVYHVKVQAWTAGWAQMVCNFIEDVEILDEDAPPVSNVCEVNVEVNGNTVAVNGLNQPVTILDIYNEDWSQVVYNCGHDDCAPNEVITGLADGIYHVKVQSYTAGWAERICDTIIDIEIGSMPTFSCDVNIIAGNDFISVSNLDEPLVSMFIFTGDYRTTLYRCSYGDCPTSKIITDLAPGAYVVKVQSYTNNFGEEICNFLQTVIVDESNTFCLDDNETHLYGVLKTGMYQAENAILSRGLVNQDTVVTFTATNDITLQSGFHANAGSSFTAMIDNCGTNTFTEPVATSRTTNKPTSLTDKFLTIAPNPFRNSTSIQYQLPHKTQQVSLMVYDMTGQLIQAPILDKAQSKGFYSVDFQRDQLLAGMYFVALSIDGEVLIEKIAVMN